MKTKEIYEHLEFQFPSWFDQSREAKIHKNPLRLEFLKLLNDSDFNELKGILNGNVIYIWDANLALHSHVLDLIQEKNNPAMFNIYSEGRLISTDTYKGEDYFLSNPNMKRMLGIK